MPLLCLRSYLHLLVHLVGYKCLNLITAFLCVAQGAVTQFQSWKWPMRRKHIRAVNSPSVAAG